MRAIYLLAITILLCVTLIATPSQALEPEEIEARKEARRQKIEERARAMREDRGERGRPMREMQRERRNRKSENADSIPMFGLSNENEGVKSEGSSDSNNSNKSSAVLHDDEVQESNQAIDSEKIDSEKIDSEKIAAPGLNLRQLEEDIPEPPTSAFDRLLKKLPTKEEIGNAVESAVTSFQKIDSINALTVPNLEQAATSAKDLLSTLGDTLVGDADIDEALRQFGENALEGFESAVVSVVKFVNTNNILQGFKVDTVDRGSEGQEVVLRKVSDGSIVSIKELDAKAIAGSVVTKVNEMLDEVSQMESMDDLLKWMESAENLQETMKDVGSNLKKVAEAIGSKVDPSQLENFTLKFR